MKKIISTLLLLTFVLLFSQCAKEDMYLRFKPEILYKRYVMVQGGGMQWQVSPDAVEVQLQPGESSFTVYARVSAPNKLFSITVSEVDGNTQKEIITYKSEDEHFLANPNVYELAYLFTDIQKNRVVRIKAVDMVGNVTERDYTILR